MHNNKGNSLQTAGTFEYGHLCVSEIGTDQVYSEVFGIIKGGK